MQHIYCTQCGSKVSYSGAKPKFCSSCGSPIGGALSNKVKKNKPTSRPEENNAESQAGLQDDETDINHVPHITDLSYEITHQGSGYKVYKFGDFVNAEQKPKSDN